MREYFFHIEDGAIKNPSAVRKAYSDLSDGRYKGTIARSNKRTLPQNAWLHAVLPDILKGLHNRGYNDIRDVNDAKLVVKALFFKKVVSNGLENIEVIEGTSQTSKEVFIERADRIINWAKDYLEIDIAPPMKQIEMFD